VSGNEWRLALWESLQADFRARGSSAMGPEDFVRHGVAWRKTDAEIWQNHWFRIVTLAERQACERLLAELRRQEQAAERAEHVGERPRTDIDPDTYREAVRGLLRRRIKPEWNAVALELKMSPSLLRQRCKEAGLPNPARIARELSR
jgi:hypothetical protein